MKSILIAFAIGLTLIAHGQTQRGQSCLFTCMYHLDLSKSVDQYIQDFSLFTHTLQDIYSDGARGSIREVAQFIRSELNTKNLDRTSIIEALDSGYSVISVVRPWGDQHSDYLHVIVLQGYYSTDPTNPVITVLIFYEPSTGTSNRRVKLEDFLANWQLYSAGVKSKASGMVLVNSLQ